MSTISSTPSGGLVAAAKGAPETIKGMLRYVPDGYDDTYKRFTRRGSRVLALGVKMMEPLSGDKVGVRLLFPCKGQSNVNVARIDQQADTGESGE